MPSRNTTQVDENGFLLAASSYSNFTPVEPDRLLRIDELLELFGYKSPQSIYNKLQPGNRYYDPDFPRQKDLGNSRHRGAARWSARAIFRYMAARTHRSDRNEGCE